MCVWGWVRARAACGMSSVYGCQWNQGHCSLGCFLMPGALQAAGTTPPPPHKKNGAMESGRGERR